jgi:hypothetical protein
VKDADHMNMLAMLADSEARSTAMLVEVIAATALFKAAPPEGDAVAELEITQGDILDAAKQFYWRADYDKHGTMRLRISRNVDSLETEQPEGAAEVTSDAG